MRLNKNIVKLHLTVFIWGFTAILGALIQKDALVLVWYRMLIAGSALLLYLVVTKKQIAVSKIDTLRLLGIGVLVGAHWYLFYHAIKISTVSVSLVCLSSVTLFISILDPIMNKKKFLWLDLATGVLIIFGIVLIFKFETRYAAGICCGLGAALLASLFTIINARESKKQNAVVISFYEMMGGFCSLTITLLVLHKVEVHALSITSRDFFYLLLLGTICTALAYVMAVAVMKTIGAFTVALVTNLEPVYGILLAILIFGGKEKMTWGFYSGALVVLIAVFMHPVLKKWFVKSDEESMLLQANKSSLLE